MKFNISKSYKACKEACISKAKRSGRSPSVESSFVDLCWRFAVSSILPELYDYHAMVKNHNQR